MSAHKGIHPLVVEVKRTKPLVANGVVVDLVRADGTVL
jgi:hypothetical protein